MKSLSVLNTSSRKQVEEYFHRQVTLWCEKYFMSAPTINVAFNDVLFATNTFEDVTVFSAGAGSLVIENSQESFMLLARQSLEINTYESVPQDKPFWEELVSAITNGLSNSMLGDEAAVLNSETLSQFESQSVLKIEVELADVMIHMHADFELVNSLKLVSKPNIASAIDNPVKDSIGNSIVKLDAKFHPISLQMSEFLELKVGDIVKLEHNVQEPILIEAPDGIVPIKSFLVKQNNNKALLLNQ